MSVRTARMQAERLVEQLGKNTLPIDVREIAAALGLQVIEEDLGEGVSGLLVSKGGAAYIFVQKKNHEHRKRFSIGHEIAHHYLGHQLESGEHVIVDKGYFISQRRPQASTGEDPKEIEANQFAASLLMPAKLLRERVANLGEGPLLDHDVSQLALEFEVSEQAMTICLLTLGLL